MNPFAKALSFIERTLTKAPKTPPGIYPSPLNPNAGAMGTNRYGPPGNVPARIGPVGPRQTYGTRAVVTSAPSGPSRYVINQRPLPPDVISDIDTGRNWFTPLQPVVPYGPPSTSWPRTFDYPVGTNLEYYPKRLQEMTMFRVLSKSWGVLRSVIETRKDQMVRIPWKFRVKQSMKEGTGKTKKPNEENEHTKILTDFFQKPDKVNAFDAWLRMMLENHLVLDATTLYNWPSKAGIPYAIESIDGATIKCLIDDAGRRPTMPNPAYQQIIKGLPMNNFTMAELLYVPANPMPEHPQYGYGRVEQIMNEVVQGILQTLYQTNFWKEGNIPDMMMSVPNEWCYSDDTEVLTDQGWKRFQDCDIATDLFATRNSKTKGFEWQHATGYYYEPYSGDMIAFQSRTMDLLVSPHHRMLVTSVPRSVRKRHRWSIDRGDAFVEAHLLLGSSLGRTKIPMVSQWNGTEIKERIFHPIQDPILRGPRVKPIVMTGDQYCAFMGMYLSEGFTGERGITICQQPASKGYSAFAQLLKDILGRDDTHDGVRRFQIGSRALAEHCRPLGKAWDKYIPAEIMNATPHQLRQFWTYFWLGDGCASRQCVYTTSRRMADQLQELAQKMGLFATIREDRRHRPSPRTGTPHRTCYNVSIVQSPASKFTVNTVKDYQGHIGCVTVPNGTLYVRRNGKPSWSGNTGKQIADFQSYMDTLLSGNVELKSKIRFVPGGMKPFELKGASGETLKTDQQEWLARVVCFNFSISPSPFIRQMNRATAQSAKDSATEEGLYPLMQWLKQAVMDPIVRDWFGFTDVEFLWDFTPEVDTLDQANTLTAYVTKTVMTPNEARNKIGLAPVVNGDDLMVFTGQGVMTLDRSIEQSQAPTQNEQPPEPAAPVAAGPTPAKGKTPAPKGKAKVKAKKYIEVVEDDDLEKTTITPAQKKTALTKRLWLNY